MISKTNNLMLRTAYPTKLSEAKEQKPTALSSQKEVSKLDQLKESIDSGEYKVNIQTLAQRMADSLL